jgi:hypothetical protein
MNEVRVARERVALAIMILGGLCGACEREHAVPRQRDGSVKDAGVPNHAPIAHGAQLPEVGLANDSVPNDAIVITVTLDALWLDDQKLLSLHAGDVDAADLEGGALGLVIPALRGAYAAKDHRGDRYALVAVDRRAPTHALISALSSLPRVSIGHVAVLSHGELRALPLELRGTAFPKKYPEVVLGADNLGVARTHGGPFQWLANATVLDAELQSLSRGDGTVILRIGDGLVAQTVPGIAHLFEGSEGRRFREVLLAWSGLDQSPEENAMADLLSSDGAAVGSAELRPGADLGQQIRQVPLPKPPASHR